MALVKGSNVSISHLGLVAGVYDSLGIGDLIDELMPKKRCHVISHGDAVKALILNSLGYFERRLYIMPDYFNDIATERLLGPGIPRPPIPFFSRQLSSSPHSPKRTIVSFTNTLPTKTDQKTSLQKNPTKHSQKPNKNPGKIT